LFALAGAIRLAKKLGRGKTIVTILCDLGMRYQSKMFNPQFLREKGLPRPEWLDRPQAQPLPLAALVDPIGGGF
jgi:cysteine synthase